MPEPASHALQEVFHMSVLAHPISKADFCAAATVLRRLDGHPHKSTILLRLEPCEVAGPRSGRSGRYSALRLTMAAWRWCCHCHCCRMGIAYRRCPIGIGMWPTALRRSTHPRVIAARRWVAWMIMHRRMHWMSIPWWRSIRWVPCRFSMEGRACQWSRSWHCCSLTSHASTLGRRLPAKCNGAVRDGTARPYPAAYRPAWPFHQ